MAKFADKKRQQQKVGVVVLLGSVSVEVDVNVLHSTTTHCD
jgi:hypothetical protein